MDCIRCNLILGPVKESDMQTPPLLQKWIRNVVPKDAQCSVTYAKTIFRFILIFSVNIIFISSFQDLESFQYKFSFSPTLMHFFWIRFSKIIRKREQISLKHFVLKLIFFSGFPPQNLLKHSLIQIKPSKIGTKKLYATKLKKNCVKACYAPLKQKEA